MRYHGGKWRQGPRIALEVARLHRSGHHHYYEPFCGALGAAQRVAAHLDPRLIHLSDSNQALITMWNAFFKGWRPLGLKVSDHAKLKMAQDTRDPNTAFVGVALSFFGRWFNPPVSRDPAKWNRYVLQTVNAMERTHAALDGATFKCTDYRRVRYRKGSTVYLDPPYGENPHAIRNMHGSAVPFDTDEFWRYADHMVGDGLTVLVTGFSAPKDWRAIWSWGDTLTVPANRQALDRKTTEQIYVHRLQK
jgi:site-specific DNA-adenine methylase